MDLFFREIFFDIKYGLELNDVMLDGSLSCANFQVSLNKSSNGLSNSVYLLFCK